MYVTQHARVRIIERMGTGLGAFFIDDLWATEGEPGTVAYRVGILGNEYAFAIAVDGSVETVYFRRKSQDCSPAFFGASKVVDLVGDAVH